MDKALFAVDELSGLLLTAAALVQPEKTIHTVTVKSVKKKMKDKAFARSVNRDDIRKGTEELGIGLDEHLEFCIEALKNVAAKLGLISRLTEILRVDALSFRYSASLSLKPSLELMLYHGQLEQRLTGVPNDYQSRALALRMSEIRNNF